MAVAEGDRAETCWAQWKDGMGRDEGGSGIIAIADKDGRRENGAEGLETADRIARREMGQIIRRGGRVLDDAEQRLGHSAAVDSSSDPAPPHRTPAPMDHPDSPRT